jgi:hypothetical protein
MRVGAWPPPYPCLHRRTAGERMWSLLSNQVGIYAFVFACVGNTEPETFGARVQLPRSRSLVHGNPSVRAFPGQGGPSGAVRPATPNRRPKGESAEPLPRRPTRADSPTPPVNEKARLDFEAGLELPQLDLNQ